MREDEQREAPEDDGWDVIMFGAYLPHSKSTASPHLKQTHCATTSHCYLVHGNYAGILREQIQRSLDLDLQFDLGWWPLQWRDRWFVTDPVLAAQRDSHSDMTQRAVQMMATSKWENKIVGGSIHTYNGANDTRDC